MLTFKKYLIDNEDDTILQFSLDTDKLGYLAAWDRFFQGELILQKPWIGKVDNKKNEFKIRRTRVGPFKLGVSMTQISGRVTEDQAKIEIKFKPIWYVTLSLVWVATFLGIIVANHFNDIFGWTTLLCIMTIQILILILDFRKTEERFIDYINRLRSNKEKQSVLRTAGNPYKSSRQR